MESTLVFIKRIGNDIFETKNEQERKFLTFKMFIRWGLFLQVSTINALTFIFYIFILYKMELKIKNFLENAENDSNDDLDFFDALDDMNTYLDSVDDFDDIDALCEGYLMFGL